MKRTSSTTTSLFGGCSAERERENEERTPRNNNKGEFLWAGCVVCACVFGCLQHKFTKTNTAHDVPWLQFLVSLCGTVILSLFLSLCHTHFTSSNDYSAQEIKEREREREREEKTDTQRQCVYEHEQADSVLIRP